MHGTINRASTSNVVKLIIVVILILMYAGMHVLIAGTYSCSDLLALCTSGKSGA